MKILTSSLILNHPAMVSLLFMLQFFCIKAPKKESAY